MNRSHISVHLRSFAATFLGPVFAVVLGCLLVILPAASAHAELPSIRFDRLTPLGAAAGTTVEAEIAGGDIEEVKSLWFDHPGLSAKPVESKERFFQITVAADVPPGTYDVRLVGRWGVSNPRLLAVTHGLKDVAETEPNNEAEKAQALEINVAVNAMSDGNNEDIFKLPLKSGQRILIDCQAGKLDSMLDATMSLATADGRILASSSDHNGRDPRIDFIAPADGEYLIRVSDLSFRGGYPYRLLVTNKPHLETIFPAVVQVGKATELTAIGRNLGQGSAQSAWKLEDRPLEELRFSFTPTDVLTQGEYRFGEHPSDHSVLPTAATCTLTGAQARLANNEAIGAQPLVVTELPVLVEAEPNDTSDKPQPLALPAAVAGRFNQPRDADWFEVSAAEAGKYTVEVFCERIRGNADPYIVVLDDQNNRIFETDDFGHRMQAFDGHLRDPIGSLDFAAGKKYRILVQDRYRRGGVRYQYVLSIHPVKPDFFPAVIHSQNPGPGGTTIWRGGAVYLDVVIHQMDGFNEPITITAENLPAGVHMLPTVVNNNSRGALVLWADDNAADFTGPIELWATGKRGDQTLKREVRAYARVWNDAGMGSSRPTRDLVIAVRDGAPFRMEWGAERVEIEAGKPVELKLKLTRRSPDFKNEVTIQPLSFPGNFQMNNTSFTGEQQEITIPITVQNGTRPGEYSLAVLGQGQVPFNKDPQAKDRPNTLVSLPSRPITLVVKPAPAK